MRTSAAAAGGGSNGTGYTGWTRLTADHVVGVTPTNTGELDGFEFSSSRSLGSGWRYTGPSGGSSTSQYNRLDGLIGGHEIPLANLIPQLGDGERVKLRIVGGGFPGTHLGLGPAVGILERGSGLRGSGIAIEEHTTATRYELKTITTAAFGFHAARLAPVLPLIASYGRLGGGDIDREVGIAMMVDSDVVPWSTYWRDIDGGAGGLSHTLGDLSLAFGLAKRNTNTFDNTSVFEFDIQFGTFGGVESGP